MRQAHLELAFGSFGTLFHELVLLSQPLKDVSHLDSHRCGNTAIRNHHR